MQKSSPINGVLQEQS